MNDRMKFRIWDKKFKRMHYLTILDIIEDEDFYYDYRMVEDALGAQKRFVLMQSTGVSNGEQLIYEADIFHNARDDIFFQVVWSDDGYWVTVSHIDNDHQNLVDAIEGIHVGNIYENPNFFEKKEINNEQEQDN